MLHSPVRTITAESSGDASVDTPMQGQVSVKGVRKLSSKPRFTRDVDGVANGPNESLDWVAGQSSGEEAILFKKVKRKGDSWKER